MVALVGAGALPAQPRGVDTVREGQGAPLKVGKQHLLIVAINKYRQWPTLTRPVTDAREVRDVLVSRYRIDRVYELFDADATKANIIRMFAQLQGSIAPEDSLLIVYAGHGHMDRSSSSGFWIPVNAGTDVYEQDNWLPHAQLRGLIANIRAAHILTISDSCFAGDLIFATRSIPTDAGEEYFQRAYARVSRQVLASGADEAVPDRSDFASQIKLILERNQEPYVDALMLYNELRLGVRSTTPLLGVLPGAGHQEGASFLFFLKPELVSRRDLGSLSVVSRLAGELYLDGVLLGPIEPGTRTLQGIEPGEHEIRIVYSDGTSETGRVEVEPRGTAAFTFAAPLPIRAAAGADWNRRVSSAIVFGTPFPLNSQLEGGTVALWDIDYNLRRRWGDLFFGLETGMMNVETPSGTRDGYRLRSYPAAARVGCASPSTLRFQLAALVAVGVVVTDVDRHGPDVTVVKILVAPTVAAGLMLSNDLRLSANATYFVEFFDDHALHFAWPAVSLEYVF
jgi:hypothetical protein